MELTPAEKTQLDQTGYLVFENFIEPAFLERLRAAVEACFEDEGDQAGAEFKQEPGCRRLANLVDKGEVFREVVAAPRVLAAMRHVLGPEFKLSSLNARSTDPMGTLPPQPLHADMGAVPDENGYWVSNSVWMLDDFTEENGPIRMLPGSQDRGCLPQDELEDPAAPHPDEILITGRAGTVVIMNAHAWHGGLVNKTAAARRALHAFYTRRDKPQQQYQKGLLRPETRATLSPELRKILALDDPLNDELSKDAGPRSGFLK